MKYTGVLHSHTKHTVYMDLYEIIIIMLDKTFHVYALQRICDLLHMDIMDIGGV